MIVTVTTPGRPPLCKKHGCWLISYINHNRNFSGSIYSILGEYASWKIEPFGQSFGCKKGWPKPNQIEAEKEIDKEKGKEEKKKIVAFPIFNKAGGGRIATTARAFFNWKARAYFMKGARGLTFNWVLKKEKVIRGKATPFCASIQALVLGAPTEVCTQPYIT